jgi:hypothetical protein
MGGEGAWHRAQWVCLCLNLNTNNLICIVLSFCFAFLSFHIVYVSHPSCRYVDLLLGEFKHYKTRLDHGGISKEVSIRQFMINSFSLYPPLYIDFHSLNFYAGV